MKPSTHPTVKEMVSRLEDSARGVVQSVVLYGPAAHGDEAAAARRLFLLIVLRDLDLPSVRGVADPIRWWLKQGEPMPRLMSARVLRDAADVFPIELLDIRAHHQVVFGNDPLATLEVQTHHLRIQCERELREKLMRLQEAYIQADGRDKALTRLMVESYLTFAELFRGCLRLTTSNVPARDGEVVDAFCELAGLNPAPFRAIAALVDGGKIAGDAEALFDDYYGQLSEAVEAVDRFGAPDGGSR